MKITQHIPNFVDHRDPYPVAEGSWEALQEVEWVKHWRGASFKGHAFTRFSRSHGDLMAEYGDNDHWWVVGTVHDWREDPEFQALPEWKHPRG